MPMLSIGIDVSKGKSTVCGMKPGGEIVYIPFEVQHEREGMSGSWFRCCAAAAKRFVSFWKAPAATIARWWPHCWRTEYSSPLSTRCG